MISIIDHRMPEAAKRSLQKLGPLIEIPSMPRLYDAIAAHPDIFFCQTPFGLVYAPQLPSTIIERLTNLGVNCVKGEESVFAPYPTTAKYNAVATEKLLIHKLSVTDARIKAFYKLDQQVNIAQAYSRCNLLELGGDAFITSDHGIYKSLIQKQIEVLLCSTDMVQLQGFRNGFFPGCCGLYEDTVYVCGNPELLPDFDEVERFCNKHGKHLKALYDGALVDVGGILILDEN